ncbi:MAG TPA: hypothetical protein VJR29_13720 [bacterium]|nr:hypothetical protein [bacterium]
MNFRQAIALALSLTALSLTPACKRQPSVSEGKKSSDLQGRGFSLKQGLEIAIAQERQVEEGQLAAGKGPWIRKLRIENPSGAEGLSFTWKMGGPSTESQPSAADSGKMILANTVGSRRMTLPLFWPGGELFMSNSSGVWLSDQAFSELKKEGKTQYDLGLVDNPLLGPAQGLPILEHGLAAYNQGLATRPERKTQDLQWEVSDDSRDYALKVNGVLVEVEALEAVSPLAKIVVLDNPQNPLVLEVEVAPPSSAARALFLPLSWMRGLLSYKVESLDLPSS